MVSLCRALLPFLLVGIFAILSPNKCLSERASHLIHFHPLPTTQPLALALATLHKVSVLLQPQPLDQDQYQASLRPSYIDPMRLNTLLPLLYLGLVTARPVECPDVSYHRSPFPFSR
ncbi:hypothetical protein CONLIGDRAFT_460755 [Coniochaeta ligniaria NRRL 30616]|uniref:Uncharacterized protein n=1 Tax=Coniochaeta ligniaria NRRL 30616 TaxID=1408157 RepID=A0A1J7J467_9PEZI|nr:hypothetical protein CONLIGDRAFT_460755 [Coniochaeta ligniaria NRRL 30616]